MVVILEEDNICRIISQKGKLSNKMKFAFSVKYIILRNKIVVAVVQSGKDIMKGVAICHEDDEFDLEIGKRIAFIDAIESR